MNKGTSEQQAWPQDLYYSIFSQILTFVKEQAVCLLNGDEQATIRQFEALSEQAKTLFVRLFIRKKPWQCLNELSFVHVPDPGASAEELRSAGFLATSESILTEESLQHIYEYLADLRKKELSALYAHLLDLCRLLLKYDHEDGSFPELERPNPVYSLALQYSSLRPLSLSISRLVSTSSPKQLLTESILRSLSSLNAHRHQLPVQAILAQIYRESLSRNWEQLVTPLHIPFRIKIPSPIAHLFHKLHHAVSCFTRDSLIEDIVLKRVLRLSFVPYRVSESFVFNTHIDEKQQAFKMAVVIDGLPKLTPNFQVRQEIAARFAQISLQRLGVFHKEDPIDCIQIFLQKYSHFAQVDWKLQFTKNWLWAKLLFKCLDLVKRSKNWALCTTIVTTLLGAPYVYTKRGECWERLAIMSKKYLLSPSKTETVVRLGLTDPLLKTGKRITIEKQAQRLGLLSEPSYSECPIVTITAPSMQDQGVLVFITDQGVPMRVQNYALNWYRLQGWTGFHSENGLLMGVYGILMWDAIFYQDIPQAFQTPFQGVPLDYKSQDFYAKRKNVFDEQCQKISACPDLYEYFLEKYQKHHRSYSRLVSWEHFDAWGKENIGIIVRNLGRAFAHALCILLANDLKSHSHGMADLVLFRGSEVKFSEVKSTNDRLSDHQRSWISLLMAHRIQVEVCKVNAKT